MKKALFSKVAGSLLLSAGLFAAGGASAQTTLTFDAAGNTTFGATHATAGNYEDVYLFAVDATSWVWGNAIVGIDRNALSNYGITDITFFSEANGTRTDLTTSFSSNGSILFSADEALTSGTYGFVVTGGTLTQGNGGYAGNLSLAPVPEPATYAMLGVGIGLLAFTARRKQNNKLG